MHVKDLCEKAHEESKRGGWHPGGETRNPLEMMMLIVSEVAEMCETMRKLDPDGNIKMSEKTPEFTALEEEAADVMIRMGDFAGLHGLRLEDAISAKMAFNRTRGHRHGNKAY